MLVTIACFLVFLGVLVTLVASREAKKDAFNQRFSPGPVKIAARIPVAAGVGLFAWSLYLSTFA